MTRMLEAPTVHYTSSPEEDALAIINAYREEMGENFNVRPLDEEFAFFARTLGASGLYLADAADNHARTFKWRGALNKMARLHVEDKDAVALVPSAGNHLRGSVVAGRALNMPVYGVVPKSAPLEKREGVRELWPDGGMFRLRTVGNNFTEAKAWAEENDHLGTLVPPYDDPLVAAGQGTLADEIHEAFQHEGVRLDRVVVPVGGGGLFAGLAKRFYQLDPHVTVDGVEAEGSNSLSRSIRAGEIRQADNPNKKYGGSAVSVTGEHAFNTYAAQPNMKLWQVDDREVETLVEDYLAEREYRELRHAPFEPTTLVAVAGLQKIARRHPGQTIAVVGTGRNDAPEAIWK